MKKTPKAYFISDLHLGATYEADGRELERRTVEWLDMIKRDATELYLLGDILDYWFEYRHVVPRGYVRFFGKLAELSDSGVRITWIIGNHDIWIFDYLPNELGVTVVDGILKREVAGVPMTLQHGDGIGGSFKFRLMRSVFRNRLCQRLYACVHPRWTVGLAHGISRRSRIKETLTGSWPQNLYEEYIRWSNEQIRAGSNSRYFIFGHLHKGKRESLEEDRTLIVLPPWNGEYGYGEFDGNDFKFHSFSLPKA